MIRNLLLVLVAGVVTTAACAQTSSQTQPTLKDAYKDAFLIGAAINRAQIYERDAKDVRIIKEQFDSITPENVLKWESVHPKPDQYDFEATDKYVEFGEKNHLAIIGHTLVWHSQTPKWVFEDESGKPVSRDVLLKRMHEHILKVVGRYKGRIKGWDVVNEALEEDGSMRRSPWFKIIGEDFIQKAFEYAHEADPKAELYYNDYNLENQPKRSGGVALMKKLQAAGVPVFGLGLQGHDTLDWPTAAQQDEAISDFEKLGLKVNITELDITVLPPVTKQPTAEVTATGESKPALNPYTNGLPDDVQQKLAERYAELFKVFLKHRNSVERVTLWGVTDGDSWRNNWPARGRTDYPLLFDRNGAPKPAFNAVIRVAHSETTSK